MLIQKVMENEMDGVEGPDVVIEAKTGRPEE
jgi:hypothetical protein